MAAKAIRTFTFPCPGVRFQREGILGLSRLYPQMNPSLSCIKTPKINVYPPRNPSSPELFSRYVIEVQPLCLRRLRESSSSQKNRSRPRFRSQRMLHGTHVSSERYESPLESSDEVPCICGDKQETIFSIVQSFRAFCCILSTEVHGSTNGSYSWTLLLYAVGPTFLLAVWLAASLFL